MISAAIFSLTCQSSPLTLAPAYHASQLMPVATDASVLVSRTRLPRACPNIFRRKCAHMSGGQCRGCGGRPYTAATRTVRHHSAEWRQLDGELSEVQEGTMRRNTSVHRKMSMYGCSVLMLLAVLAA